MRASLLQPPRSAAPSPIPTHAPTQHGDTLASVARAYGVVLEEEVAPAKARGQQRGAPAQRTSHTTAAPQKLAPGCEPCPYVPVAASSPRIALQPDTHCALSTRSPSAEVPLAAWPNTPSPMVLAAAAAAAVAAVGGGLLLSRGSGATAPEASPASPAAAMPAFEASAAPASAAVAGVRSLLQVGPQGTPLQCACTAVCQHLRPWGLGIPVTRVRV
jgi:hypothetical protein